MMVSYEYPGFLCSWEHRTNNMENANRVMAVTFYGDKGTLYLDRALFRLTPEKGSGLEAMEVKRGIDGHPAHWTNFLDCVHTRKRPNSEIETCVRSTTACLLGNVSLRTRLRLDWDDSTKTVKQPEAGPLFEAGLPRAVEAGSIICDFHFVLSSFVLSSLYFVACTL